MPQPHPAPSQAANRPALDRVGIRVPGIAHVAAAGLARLPAGSETRRRLLVKGLAAGFAAVNRSDVEAILPVYEPDVEIWTTGMPATGIRECYRGHAGVREMFAELDDVFSLWGWKVHSVVDGGDRIAARLDFETRGRGSGAATSVKNAGSAYFLSARGRVTRQNFHMEEEGWRQARKAVGLPD